MGLSWEEHIKRYNEQNKTGKVSIAEYAKANELNPNTARRYLRNPEPATKKPTKNTRKTSSNKGRPKTGEDVKAGASDQSNYSSGQNQKVITDHSDDRNTRKNGNENSVKHGLYMTPRSRDLKAARDIMAQGGVPCDYLVERLLAHLEVLERAREESMYYLDHDYEPGEDGPVAAVKKLGMLLPVAPAIADLVRAIAQIQSDTAKGVREQQKHDNKLSEPEVIREAYRLQKECNWEPTETAAYIEANGCKVPTFLLKLVDAELKAPPETDDDGGESVDDLDRLARESRERRLADLDGQLEVKRAAIADIVDTGGFGDLDSSGGVSGIELAEFDDDEEPDDSLNHQLYGDDD
jgi:hypothetical protein